MKRKATLASMTLLVVVATALLAFGHLTQFCTPGFFKTHPQFITGGSCISLDQNTPVGTLFHTVDSCVANLTMLQAISVPTNFCGEPNGLPGGEIILLRQTIARVANAANSNPPACDVMHTTIKVINDVVDQAIAMDDRSLLITAADKVGQQNNDSVCTI